jgi:hypothetical protein
MDQNQSLFSLNIDPSTKLHLNETARWARFLAIVGIILLLLAIVGMVTGMTFLSNTSRFELNGRQVDEMNKSLRIATLIGSVIMIAILFFPLLFLLQFSSRMKRALAANDQELLNDAFLNLKKYFRYIGVVMIVIISIYAIVFLLAIMGSALTS